MPYGGRNGRALGFPRAGAGAKISTVMALVFASACDSEATTMKVTAEATFLVNRSATAPAKGGECGEVAPAALAERNFTITSVDGERATVRDDNGGCELDVTVSERRYHAENARCRLADDTPLRMLGVISRTYDLFVLDLGDGTYTAGMRTIRNTTAGEVRNCAVEEGRVVVREQ